MDKTKASQKANSKPGLFEGKNGPYETRRNAAVCRRTNNVSEPHYAGILVVEGLRDGAKLWVHVGVREIKAGKRIGQKYLSITLKPVQPSKEENTHGRPA